MRPPSPLYEIHMPPAINSMENHATYLTPRSPKSMLTDGAKFMLDRRGIAHIAACEMLYVNWWWMTVTVHEIYKANDSLVFPFL
jgi:hypothetical protein